MVLTRPVRSLEITNEERPSISNNAVLVSPTTDLDRPASPTLEGASVFDGGNAANAAPDGVPEPSRFAAPRSPQPAKKVAQVVQTAYALHVGHVRPDGARIGGVGKPGQAGGVLSARVERGATKLRGKRSLAVAVLISSLTNSFRRTFTGCGIFRN